MYIVGIQREQAIDVVVDFASQSVLDPLRTMARCFLGSPAYSRRDRARGSCGRTRTGLARPVRALDAAISELEVFDTKRMSKIARGVDECTLDMGSSAAAPP
jgi:hypothetical protein